MNDAVWHANIYIHIDERLRLAKERNARCVLETKTIEALKRSVDWVKMVH